MNSTSIEWCNRPETRGPAGAKTWNPIRARIRGVRQLRASAGTFCTRISPGCTHCYASTINKRFGNGLEYTVPNLEKIEFFIDERILEEPLKQKKPCTIFVGDMFDLFHEAIPDTMLYQVYSAAHEACIECGHVIQFLTKRAQRQRDFLVDLHRRQPKCPHERMWFGVSVEDQQRHDERAPILQDTPAAIRFLSIEPQLEAIRLAIDTPEVGEISTLRGFDGCDPPIAGIDWVICGGESGPGARPFNLEWAESLLKQCREAGVPFFMKQIGSNPFVCSNIPQSPDVSLRKLVADRKGGDPAEWIRALRVREFPAVAMAVQP